MTAPTSPLDAPLAPRGPVVIVMSTYNGAGHVREQLESISAQTMRDWRLLVRDDGSADDTLAIVRECASHDSRIALLPPDGRNLRAPASFGVLLAHARASGAWYVLLADQDDVWSPDKVAYSINALCALERERGVDCPLLVHTDLEVVGPGLEPIAPSFAKLQHLPGPRGWHLSRLLVQNVVTGCTAAINRALLDIVVPFPTVSMHDWWLAQCAAAFGHIEYLSQPTVRYRQHGNNVVGAKGWAAMCRDALRSPIAWWIRGYANFVGGLQQVHALRVRAASASSDAARDATTLIGAYQDAMSRSGLRLVRLYRVLASGVRPESLLLQLIFFARVATYVPRADAR